MTFSVGEFHLITYAERADSAEMSIVVMCADNHVALIDTDTGTCNVLSDTTKVWCKNYTDADILDYISREEPYDKAGSYAIQGYFGRYIDRIDGDYENVVGLPYYRIEPLIQNYL